MNIIVLGGGGKPGKFGKDFVNKAREQGHRVIVLSHRDHMTGNTDDRTINYRNLESIKPVLQNIAKELPVIDIILFNQNGAGYPFSAEELFVEPNISEYNSLINIHVAVPHLIVAMLYENLIEGSKVIFMSSTMAFEYDRNNFGSMVGYPAAKSFVTHLMSSMSRSRTKNVTFSAVCPYFMYNEPEKYQETLQHLYTHIFEHDDTLNGKIMVQSWESGKAYKESKVKYG